MLHDLIVSWYGENTWTVLAMIYRFYPIWLPLILGIVFWELWVWYVRYFFFLDSKTILLEIKLPRDIYKSPTGMEIALNSLFQTGGETTVVDRYWKGRTRAWFSLEIASFGGEVHFFIWLRENMRNIIEANLYAQFPDIEVRQVEDYAKRFVFNPTVNMMWAVRQVFTKPNGFPIRTYIDYGLDKDPKEELENDPLVNVLEFLGAIKPGENIMIQIVVRAHKKEKRRSVFSRKTDWEDEARAEVKEIQKRIKEDERQRPTQAEAEQIDGIERSLGKAAFDAEIRIIYITDNGKKDVFNYTTFTGLRNVLKPFSSNNLNGFKPNRSTDWDYPWQDFKDLRVNRMKRKYLDAYKRRMAFYAPYQEKTMVLTAEELATLFHFPGKTAATPGLVRIPSKRAQAPSNLPI